MSNRMMIRCDSEDFSRWQWSLINKQNQPEGEPGTGNLEALAAKGKGHRLVLVLPGKLAMITSVALPGGSNRALSRAIPFALEEQVAEDIEGLHFARGKRLADGKIPIVAISKTILSEILKCLSSVGLQVQQAVVEPLILPWRAGTISLVIRDTTAKVRYGEAAGFECSVGQLPILLSHLRNEQQREMFSQVTLWAENTDDDPPAVLSELADEVIVKKTVTTFSELVELSGKSQVIDLLDGFGESESETSNAGSWWPAVALLVIAACVYIGTTGYQNYLVTGELKALTEKTNALFRSTFPNVKRLVKPVVQAQQALDQRRIEHGQGADNLLELLSILGKVKQKNASIVLKNLEYRQNNLVIHLEGKSVSQIEQFKQQLESQGRYDSEILSTVSKDQAIEARIKLKAGAA